ncbi:MAG: hypothetical protein NVS9B9_20190 [Ktedonobacteraceae bacterium]
MADNIQIQVGNGPNMVSDDVGGGVQLPYTKLDVGAHGVSSRVYSRGLPGRVPVRLTRDWARAVVTVPVTPNYPYSSGTSIVGGVITFANIFSAPNQFGTIESITYSANPGAPPYLFPHFFFFSGPLAYPYYDTQSLGSGNTAFQGADRLKYLGDYTFSYNPVNGTDFISTVGVSLSIPVTSSDKNLYCLIQAGYSCTWGTTPAPSVTASIVVRRD